MSGKAKQSVAIGALAAFAAAAPLRANDLTISPDSARHPHAKDVAAAYPASARSRGIEGAVLLDCAVTPAGGMTDCRVVSEGPANEGFAASALQLSKLFVLRSPPSPGERPARMRLPIRFSLPRS